VLLEWLPRVSDPRLKELDQGNRVSLGHKMSFLRSGATASPPTVGRRKPACARGVRSSRW
jgi:hypothetical protein